MAWVKSEYAGELAVISAWIAAVLPWYVSYAPNVDEQGSVLYVRFPFVQIRYLFGLPFADALWVTNPVRSKTLDSGAIETAYVVWWVGLGILAVAVALSLFMYFEFEDVAAALPLHPVRAMGVLLTLAGVVLAAATVLFYTRTIFGEIPVPIGLAILLALGVILLRVEIVEDSGGESGEDSSGGTGEDSSGGSGDGSSKGTGEESSGGADEARSGSPAES